MTEKDKKEIKGYMKKLSDNFGKQIGVYVEDVNGRFKALKEGTDATNDRLSRIEKTLSSHQNEIAKLMVNMEDVRSGVEEVKSDIKELRADMLEVKSNVRDTRFFATTIINTKVEKRQFVDLEKRVRELEK